MADARVLVAAGAAAPDAAAARLDREPHAEVLGALNAKPMRHYGGASRADPFARLDQPALRPLPPVPFEYAEWRHARVNPDYHIAVDHHAYSVPHAPVHEAVEVRLTATLLEVFHRRSQRPIARWRRRPSDSRTDVTLVSGERLPGHQARLPRSGSLSVHAPAILVR